MLHTQHPLPPRTADVEEILLPDLAAIRDLHELDGGGFFTILLAVRCHEMVGWRPLKVLEGRGRQSSLHEVPEQWPDVVPCTNHSGNHLHPKSTMTIDLD